MNKTTAPDVTLSRVERTHAWWAFLWPFQSWREVQFTIAMLTFGLLVMGVIFYQIDPEGLGFALTCSAIGGFIGVYGALPARLTLATCSEARHHLADLQAWLAKCGYVTSDQSALPGNYHYRSKLPRWLICDAHDNLKLVVRDHEIVLTGPIAPLVLLRGILLRTEDHAYLRA